MAGGRELVGRRRRIEFSRILAARRVGRRSRNSAGECSRLEAREPLERERSLSGPGPRSPEYWRLAIIKNSKKERRGETEGERETGREKRGAAYRHRCWLRLKNQLCEPSRQRRHSPGHRENRREGARGPHHSYKDRAFEPLAVASQRRVLKRVPEPLRFLFSSR